MSLALVWRWRYTHVFGSWVKYVFLRGYRYEVGLERDTGVLQLHNYLERARDTNSLPLPLLFYHPTIPTYS